MRDTYLIAGFCQTSSQFQYLPASLASQPFIATLNYINSSDALHPNKLHIHIEIPHEVRSIFFFSNIISN